MSINERINELERHAADQEEINRRESERLDAAASARIHEELPRVKEQQHVLLERLRRLGVLAMIEEMTEEKIPPLIRRQRKVAVPFPNSLADFRRSSKKGRKKFEEALRPKDWSAEVQYPQFEEGKWDGNLRIVVVKNDTRYQYPMPLPDEPKVIVSYDIARFLTIAGREVTFSGSVPTGKAERVEILEGAFAKAFRDPERKKPRRPEPSHCFGEPIGARA